MADDGPVLMVGGTGALGRQVVEALLARGKRVRMLARPTSDVAEFKAKGIEIARGDMMDLPTLVEAMNGAAAVVSSAAGYTQHSAGDSADADTIGNRNLVDAAARSGVRRFVLTSILTCDKTPQVPHFWHKKLVEDYLVEREVPYVALRPGAFIETLTQFGGDPFAKGRLIYAGSARTPMTFVHTPDLARNLAQAVDAPGIDGEHIDLGWDRATSVTEIAEIASDLLGKRVKTTVLSGKMMDRMTTLAWWTSTNTKDMAKMVRWFQSGEYVADTTRQREVFGAPPTAEEAVAGFLTTLGHSVSVPV